jgi:hypothetical protein
MNFLAMELGQLKRLAWEMRYMLSVISPILDKEQLCMRRKKATNKKLVFMQFPTILMNV